MRELNLKEIDEVSGGLVFLLAPVTPAIAAGIAAGALTLGAATVATFVGLRALYDKK